MDATVSYSNGVAISVHQSCAAYPDILSRGHVKDLCRVAAEETQRLEAAPGEHARGSEDWESYSESLHSLGNLAHAGLRIPNFGHWPRFVRRAARLAARGVLFLSKFIVVPQAQFNAAAVNLLHDLAARTERSRVGQRASARRVEQEMQERISSLETRMAELQAELCQLRTAGSDT